MFLPSPQTVELIKGIAGLFTDEEKAYLETKRGDHTLTILYVLFSKYHSKYVIYDYETSMAHAHQLINDHQDLLLKIKEQYNYCLLLSQPDSFNKEKTIEVKNETGGKHMGILNTNSGKENLTYSTVTGGTSERSFDYKKIPEWQREHMNSLQSNIQLNFNSVTNTDIKKAEIKTVYDESQINPKPFLDETALRNKIKDEDEEDIDYLNNISTQIASNKLATKRIDSTLDFNTKTKTQDKKETHLTSVKAINVIKAISIELPQLRNRFFNIFDVLFNEFELCQ